MAQMGFTFTYCFFYDYSYKGEDADEILCQMLKDNEISAVAITDHFKIDKDRIRHLRELSRDVVFFPAVELRTDKGSRNLHVIIIFSNKLAYLISPYGVPMLAAWLIGKIGQANEWLKDI